MENSSTPVNAIQDRTPLLLHDQLEDMSITSSSAPTGSSGVNETLQEPVRTGPYPLLSLRNEPALSTRGAALRIRFAWYPKISQLTYSLTADSIPENTPAEQLCYYVCVRGLLGDTHFLTAGPNMQSPIGVTEGEVSVHLNYRSLTDPETGEENNVPYQITLFNSDNEDVTDHYHLQIQNTPLIFITDKLYTSKLALLAKHREQKRQMLQEREQLVVELERQRNQALSLLRALKQRIANECRDTLFAEEFKEAVTKHTPLPGINSIKLDGSASRMTSHAPTKEKETVREELRRRISDSLKQVNEPTNRNASPHMLFQF